MKGRLLLFREIVYSAAKEDESNILYKLSYRNLQDKFFNHLDLNRCLIEAAVSYHLGLKSPVTCYVARQEGCRNSKMGKRKLGIRRVGVQKKGPSKANKRFMPTIKPGAKKTSTSLTEMVSTEMGLSEVIREEASAIDTNDKDTEVDNTDVKDNSLRPAPANMAFPITPPYAASGGDWTCGVDYNRKEYTTSWSGGWQTPSLLGFPNIQGLTIQEPYQSDEKRRCWQRSTLLGYGSYAYIRILNESSRYPILKIAHQGDAKRHFISREFEILKLLNTQPIVRVQEEPVSDENGLFGFYMQKLCKINIVELAERLDELEDAIKKVHGAGIAINDVSISNIMLDAQDKITLIDFGFAGRIGEEVPHFFPPWKLQRARFSIETDNDAFDEICKLCKEGTLQIPDSP